MKKFIAYVLMMGLLATSLVACGQKVEQEQSTEVVEEVVDPCEETGIRPMLEENQKYFEVSAFNVKEYDLFEERETKETLKELVEKPHNAVFKLYGGFEDDIVSEIKLRFISENQLELKIKQGVEENKRTGFSKDENEKTIVLDFDSDDYKAFLDTSDEEKWLENKLTKDLMVVFGVGKGEVEKEEIVVEQEKVDTEKPAEEAQKKEEKTSEVQKTDEKVVGNTETEDVTTTEEKEAEKESIKKKTFAEQFVEELQNSLYGSLLVLDELRKEDEVTGTHLNCRKENLLASYIAKLKPTIKAGDNDCKEQCVQLMFNPFLKATRLTYEKGEVTNVHGVYAVKHFKYVNTEPQTDRFYVGVVIY